MSLPTHAPHAVLFYVYKCCTGQCMHFIYTQYVTHMCDDVQVNGDNMGRAPSIDLGPSASSRAMTRAQSLHSNPSGPTAAAPSPQPQHQDEDSVCFCLRLAADALWLEHLRAANTCIQNV